MPALCVGTQITEISTLFLNLRWMLITEKRSEGKLYFLNQVVFGLLFFIFRVIYYPVMIYRGIQAYGFLDRKGYPNGKYYFNVTLCVLYTLLYFLQLFWFYKIVSSITRNSKREKKKTRKSDGAKEE